MSFLIKGKRWFQESYGNTYHSVEILDDNFQVIAYEPFSYGYGDQYIQTAIKMLIKMGLLPGGTKSHWQSLQEHGIETSVLDVKRKKDL